MGRLDTIKAQTAAVLGLGPAGMVEGWQYRALSGLPTAQPRAYTDWGEIHGLPSERRVVETYDADRQVSARQETQKFRVNQYQPILYPGDQLQDPAGLVWAVLGTQSSGPGTVAYQIAREIGMLGQAADRKGGV